MLLLKTITYFLGNSTKMVTATMMMKSKMVSLYISWPTRVSQHCAQQENRHDDAEMKVGLMLAPTCYSKVSMYITNVKWSTYAPDLR